VVWTETGARGWILGLSWKGGTGDERAPAEGTGGGVVAAGQAPVVRLRGQEGGPLEGGLVLEGTSEVEAGGLGRGIEPVAPHHTAAMFGDVLEVTAQEGRGGECHLGGLPLSMGVEPIGVSSLR
jgi:hypothetical protein